MTISGGASIIGGASIFQSHQGGASIIGGASIKGRASIFSTPNSVLVHIENRTKFMQNQLILTKYSGFYTANSPKG